MRRCPSSGQGIALPLKQCFEGLDDQDGSAALALEGKLSPEVVNLQGESVEGFPNCLFWHVALGVANSWIG
jgi:hypothetical protein